MWLGEVPPCTNFQITTNVDGQIAQNRCYLLGGQISRNLKKNKMSLDVYLNRKRYLSYDEGKTYTEETEQVYWANITHNLNTMAGEAGIYEHLWRPDEIKITKAKELIEPLRQGLHNLKSEPERYKKFKPENGWGSYDGLVKFVENYLNACYEYPDADVEVSR